MFSWLMDRLRVKPHGGGELIGVVLRSYRSRLVLSVHCSCTAVYSCCTGTTDHSSTGSSTTGNLSPHTRALINFTDILILAINMVKKRKG